MLLREAVAAQFLEVFKARLDLEQPGIVEGILVNGRGGRMRWPFNPNHSMNLS